MGLMLSLGCVLPCVGCAPGDDRCGEYRVWYWFFVLMAIILCAIPIVLTFLMVCEASDS